MKLQESEDFLNGFKRHNLKVEMKQDIFEYTNKNANPEINTISRGVSFNIPIFI